MTKNAEISRIKEMMSYGLQTESKKPYSSVEYFKEGADQKIYGILREGTKYYIKVCNDKKNIVKENFDYIGGFNNRKNHEYNSYANALKQFDLKMMSINEACANGKQIVIESWNPDKQKDLAVESIDAMRSEIMRQRQIMGNAKNIFEGKCCESGPFCEPVDKKYSSEKNNQKNEFNANKVDDKSSETCAEINENEVLGWHQSGQGAQGNINDTYLDTSKGTKIGSSFPFDKGKSSNDTEVVEEGESMAMDNGDNINKPKPGTGEVGDDAPFTQKVNESIDDLDDTMDDDIEGSFGPEVDDDMSEDDIDAPMDDDDLGDDDLDDEDYDDDLDDDLDGDFSDDNDAEIELDNNTDSDVDARLDSIESTLDAILDKLNAINDSDYDDEPLYDDSDDDMGDDYSADAMDDDMDSDMMGDEDMDDADMMGDDMADDEMMDDDTEDDDEMVYETRSYRNMKRRINEENRLDMWGKHPAYQKHVMTLPANGEDKNQWGRDWNDDSVHGDAPYGQKIGSSAPFEIDPQTIENSIAEAIKKVLGKRKMM